MENSTLNYSAWNTDRVLRNLGVRLGEHNLQLSEGTQLDLAVTRITAHPRYSKSQTFTAWYADMGI